MSTIGSATYKAIFRTPAAEAASYSNWQVSKWRIAAPPQDINNWNPGVGSNGTNYSWQTFSSTTSDDNKRGDGGTFSIAVSGPPVWNGSTQFELTFTISFPDWYLYQPSTAPTPYYFTFPGHLVDVVFLLSADYNGPPVTTRNILFRGGASRVDLWPAGTSPTPGPFGFGGDHGATPNTGGWFETTTYDVGGTLRPGHVTTPATVEMRGAVAKVDLDLSSAQPGLLNYWGLLKTRESGTDYGNPLQFVFPVGDYLAKDTGYIPLRESGVDGIGVYQFDVRGNVYYRLWQYGRPPLRCAVFDNDAGELTSLTNRGGATQFTIVAPLQLQRRNWHLQQAPGATSSLDTLDDMALGPTLGANIGLFNYATSADVRDGFSLVCWRDYPLRNFGFVFTNERLKEMYSEGFVRVHRGTKLDVMDSTLCLDEMVSLDAKLFLDNAGYGMAWLTPRLKRVLFSGQVVYETSSTYDLYFARRFAWGQRSDINTASGPTTITPAPGTSPPFDGAVLIKQFTSIGYPEFFLWNSEPWGATTLYLSNLADGLWKSDDTGATWTQSGDFTAPWVDGGGAKYLGWTCAQIWGGRWITVALDVAGLTPATPLPNATLSPPTFTPTPAKIVIRTSDNDMKTWSAPLQVGEYPLAGSFVIPPIIGEMRQSKTTILYLTNGADYSYLSRDGAYWYATPTDLADH